MANETINQQEKDYNKTLKNIEDAMANFEQTFAEVSQALIENKVPTKTANEIIAYLIAIKRSLSAVNFELHAIKNQPTEEGKK